MTTTQQILLGYWMLSTIITFVFTVKRTNEYFAKVEPWNKDIYLIEVFYKLLVSLLTGWVVVPSYILFNIKFKR